MSLILFLVQLVVAAFIIRFHTNHYRLNFNPIARRLDELTEPVVSPVRMLAKKAKIRTPADPSPLIIAIILAVIAGIALSRGINKGFSFGIFWLFGSTWVNVMIYSLIISAIASWLQTPPHQPVLQICYACHEFFMKHLRRIIPPFGGLDITPMLAIFALFFIQNQLLAPLALS